MSGLWGLRVLPFLAGLALACQAVADVVINEVQSSNEGTFAVVLQKSGWAVTNSPDWVELHNSGSTAVDLAGWGFSDKAGEPYRWTFPAGAKIPARGYLLLVADERDDAEDVSADKASRPRLHLPFSLSAEGGTLRLTSRDGALSRTVSFGRLPCDASCSFDASGRPDRYYAKGTPGAANAGTVWAAPLAPVSFSRGRGLFATGETIALTLDHEDPDAEIVYTTDHSDPSATNGVRYERGATIKISKTTVVRATALKPGALPWPNVTAHSYLYPDQVLDQKKPACAADTWKTFSKYNKGWEKGSCPASYGPSTNVLCDAASLAQFVASVHAAPVVSVTMSDEAMFNPTNGLHSKPYDDKGRPGGELPANVEWVSGNGDTNLVFGLLAGLKMEGGWGRYFDGSSKKSFQIKFRSRYGTARLSKDVLGEAGCPRRKFKSLVLRAEFHDSWTESDPETQPYGSSMKDEFWRETSEPVLGYAVWGTHVHLYVNGLYWGLYNLTEHADDDLAAAIAGGEGGDYVMVKNQANGNANDVISGPKNQFYDVAKPLWQAAVNFENAVKGGAARDAASAAHLAGAVDMSERGNYERVAGVLDVDNLIAYMHLGHMSGNWDWPQNNWNVFGMPRAETPMRFRWMVWDFETTCESLNYDRVSLTRLDANAAFTGNPGHLTQALLKSPEFRLKFADKFDELTRAGGPLSAGSLTNRYLRLAAKVRPRLFAEAARWGAYWHEYDPSPDRRFTRAFGLAEWDAERDRVVGEVLPFRAEVVRRLLKAEGAYPADALPPVVTVSADGRRATLAPQAANVGATVYVTTDGRDPCDPWAAPAAQAVGTRYAAGTEIAVGTRAVLKARVRLANGEWSTLATATLKGSGCDWNDFATGANGKQWGKAANWSLGEVPDGPGAAARIGVPTEANAKNGWRNVHVDAQTFTVGHLEIACGGWTNRLDSGNAPGGLTFDGGGTNATVTVSDADGAGLAMIDVDGVVSLASDIVFDVRNPAGDATYGALWAKGGLNGNGRTLVKTGAGKMTFGFGDATDARALGAIRLEAGELAVYRRLDVTGEVTGERGTVLSLEINTNDTGVAAVRNVSCAALDVPDVRLFLKSSRPGVYVGGCWAASLPPVERVTVYVPQADGAFGFGGARYAKVNAPALAVVTRSGRKAYRVVHPTPTGPTVIDETGFGAVIERRGADYVVRSVPAALRELEIAGVRPGFGGKVVVPADTLETIRGVATQDLALTVNGIGVAAGCFVGARDGAFSTALDPAAVRPAIAADGAIPAPFKVSGGVTVTVRPIAGLRYALLRGASPDAVTETAKSRLAETDAPLELSDPVPPAGKAFYRVRVSK